MAASRRASRRSNPVIDLKLLRASPDQVRSALARRGDASVTKLLDELEALDIRRRALTGQLDQLKAEGKGFAKTDAQLVKQHGKLSPKVVEQRRQHGQRITALEHELGNIESVLDAKALFVPNPPLPEVPDGDARHNKVMRAWGEAVPASGPPHVEMAERLGLVDFVRGAKLAGSGFPVFGGQGARLVRALINFMLDLHAREHGYVEVEPPFLARREIMQGTGQLPKFAEDAYRTDPDDLFLIPTAEVPVTNLLRDEVVDGATLPRGYVAYTPCFRREAGAAGKDTRGLLRVHQFDKVELVRFSRAAESAVEHERLTGHAEEVLRRLALPYRVVLLAAGDLGFASAKTYDLEVWAPGVGAWLECSSSSTFTDFQARRANIRCRPQPGGKVEFVHTLNASGVALPRTIAALLDLAAQVRALGIPIAVTDTAGHVSAMANAPLAPNADSVTLRRWITQLDAVNTPMVQPGVGTIHYGPLPAARRFTVLAVLEGAVFLCLALLAVWAYRSQVAAARDRLWVAMARESGHQLGTPLMSLTGWIAYLRENPGTPVGELADHLEADAERLQRVAKRFERIGRPARREPVGLGTAAERIVAYFRPRLPTLAHSVKIALASPGAGPTVTGDPVLIEWALEVIVKNAVDALSGRGGLIDVEVAGTAAVGRISVRDDGPGVAPEMQRE